jgi:phosphate-selective porin OprO and OprP
LKLRGLLHADARWFFEGESASNNDTFLLRRVRPIVEGTAFNIFDFRFTPDFGNGKTVIQDAYVDARFLPWLQLYF